VILFVPLYFKSRKFLASFIPELFDTLSESNESDR